MRRPSITDPSEADRLGYAHQMLTELAAMTRGMRFPMLTYLIEMAIVECSDQIAATKGDTINPPTPDDGPMPN